MIATTYTLKDLTPLTVPEADWLIGFLSAEGFRDEYFNGSPTCRRMVWYGKEIADYDKPFPTIREARAIHPFFDILRERYYPTADSILAYRYPRGGSISEHRDKGCERTVVMINLFDCPRDLLGEKRYFQDFRWGGNTYNLSDGAIIAFDSWVAHAAKPAPVPRYSITFRKTLGD
jgi:hypothetical protein